MNCFFRYIIFSAVISFSIFISACDSKSDSSAIVGPRVNGIDASFQASPISGTAALSVNFAVSNPDNDITYAWSFGDGTGATGATQTHVYQQAGIYTASLRASDTQDREETSNLTISVDSPVSIDTRFNANPQSGLAPLSVNFSVVNPAQGMTYSWDFGDGSTGSGQTVSHVYSSPNTYLAALTVSDGQGNQDSASTSITVQAQQPATNDAAFSPSLASGVIPLTVDFTVDNPDAGNQYNWDFGGGATSTQMNPSYIFTQEGRHTVTLTVTTPSGNLVNSQIINAFVDLNNTSVIVPNSILFFDDFDYVVGREDPNAASIFTTQSGWYAVRTQQSNGGGGYFHTTTAIPGYTGTFPGASSNRVLAMEMLPATTGGQTDAYLQYGSAVGSTETVPGDVWFQFWMYVNNFGDQQSRFTNRNKFIYPCGSFYPCNTNKWVIQIGPNSENPYSVQLPRENIFFYQRSNMIGDPNYSLAPYPERIGPQVTSTYMAPNRWTLVKLHYDTSHPTDGAGNAGPNKFEMWLKPVGQDWVKVTEWISGVTPNFTWHLTQAEAGGHRVFRMPTTFPGNGNATTMYNSWMYMDDFAMATSEADLPVYPY